LVFANFTAAVLQPSPVVIEQIIAGTGKLIKLRVLHKDQSLGHMMVTPTSNQSQEWTVSFKRINLPKLL